MRPSLLLRALLGVSLSASGALAQDPRALFQKIDWSEGPGTAELGSIAEIGVPASCRYTDEKGAKLFMEVTENPPTGNELGILLCLDTRADTSTWFVVFSYNATGYVKDDEKEKLDGAAILKQLQEGTEAGNAMRRRRGWGELQLVGWRTPPYYDQKTNNLTWSTLVRAKGYQGESVNHSVRLLGRGGVMDADVVADPAQMDLAVAVFDSALTEFSYLPGQTYAEWKPGDKIAEYGLTALIAGGAGAAAVKYGLFGKLWKMIIAFVLAAKKLIALAVVAIGAAIKKFVMGRKDGTTTAAAKPAAKSGSADPRPFKPVSYKPPPGVQPAPIMGDTSTPASS